MANLPARIRGQWMKTFDSLGQLHGYVQATYSDYRNIELALLERFEFSRRCKIQYGSVIPPELN